MTTPLVSVEELRAEFGRCQRGVAAVEASMKRGDDETLQRDIQDLLKRLDVCALSIRTLQVFSSNERTEDMNTEDLLLLLCDFYRGGLQLRVMGPARLGSVRRAMESLEAHLTTCERVGVLKKAFPDQDVEELLVFEGVGREEKIERWTRAKAARERVQVGLSPACASAHVPRGAPTTCAVERERDAGAGGEGGAESGPARPAPHPRLAGTRGVRTRRGGEAGWACGSHGSSASQAWPPGRSPCLSTARDWSRGRWRGPRDPAPPCHNSRPPW